jgi:hypothetical protein
MLTAMFSKRGGRLLLRLTVVSAILGGAAVAGAATSGVFNGTTGGPGGSPTFGVLSSPATPLPEGSLTALLRQVGGTAGVEAHLALNAGGVEMFAVASRDGRYLCLTVRSDDGTANTCRVRSEIARDDVIWINRTDENGVSQLFGLVPDGITSTQAGAERAIPSNNAFVIRDIPSSVGSLVVDGAGVHRVLPILGQQPTTTTTVP